MKLAPILCSALLVASISAIAATPEESRQQRMDQAYQDYKSAPADTPAAAAPVPAHKPGMMERAGTAIKHGAEATGSAIKHGAEKTGEVIKHGAEATGSAIKHGAEKTGEFVGKGVEKTGEVIHKAGEKIQGK